MKKMAYLFAVIICATPLYSHPGRTDANGGHNGPDGYHYHNQTPNTGTQNNNQVIESDEIKKQMILAILNSNDSVADVKDMDGDFLYELSQYAARGPTTLIMADRTVFTYLVQREFDRREMAPGNFSSYLQRLNTTLQTNINRGGDVAIYRRQQNIVQAFISKYKQ